MTILAVYAQTKEWYKHSTLSPMCSRAPRPLRTRPNGFLLVPRIQRASFFAFVRGSNRILPRPNKKNDGGLSPQKIRCVNDRVPSRSGGRHSSYTTRHRVLPPFLCVHCSVHVVPVAQRQYRIVAKWQDSHLLLLRLRAEGERMGELCLKFKLKGA